MTNAIILHGGPGKEEYYNTKGRSQSNSSWIPWLQQQLICRDIPTATPEVPFAFDRNWNTWSKEVERYDMTPDTILVGHSTGAGFFVKYLSIHKNLSVQKLVLVAPWLDPDRQFTKNFFDDFTIDPDLDKRVPHITVFNSDNDMDSVQKSVQMIRKAIRTVRYKEFHNYGHLDYESGGLSRFPELLQEILT